MPTAKPIDLAALEQRLEACFLVVMRGRAENDGYNALVLEAGLPWRDVALIRTISRFLRQVRVPYSQDYMWATLRKHAAIANRRSCALFHARFDPRLESRSSATRARGRDPVPRIEEALQGVESLDEDRILRRFVNAVQAAVRTNFYQIDATGQPKARDRRSSSTAAASRTCRCRARCARSSSIRRASKACTCASARSRAAACAGPTGRRISAPRCSAWSRRSR